MTITKFQVGDHVKVHPATDSFMQGFAYGTVVRVGRKYVRVAWTLNAGVTRAFTPDLLELVSDYEPRY